MEQYKLVKNKQTGGFSLMPIVNPVGQYSKITLKQPSIINPFMPNIGAQPVMVTPNQLGRPNLNIPFNPIKPQPIVAPIQQQLGFQSMAFPQLLQPNNSIQLARPLLPTTSIGQFSYPENKFNYPFVTSGPKIDLAPKYNYVSAWTPTGYAIKKIPINDNRNTTELNFPPNLTSGLKPTNQLVDGWNIGRLTNTNKYAVMYKSGTNEKIYTGAGVMLINKGTNNEIILFKSQVNNLYSEAGGDINMTELNFHDKSKILQLTAKRELREESRNLFNVDDIDLDANSNNYVDIQHDSNYYRCYIVVVSGLPNDYQTKYNANRDKINASSADSSWKETTEITKVVVGIVSGRNDISERTKKGVTISNANIGYLLNSPKNMSTITSSEVDFLNGTGIYKIKN